MQSTIIVLQSTIILKKSAAQRYYSISERICTAFHRVFLWIFAGISTAAQNGLEISKPLYCKLYSYFSASIGLSSEALYAG